MSINTRPLAFGLFILGLNLTPTPFVSAQDDARKPFPRVLVTQIRQTDEGKSQSIQSIELSSGKARALELTESHLDPLLLAASPGRQLFASNLAHPEGQESLVILDSSGKLCRSLKTSLRVALMAFESEDSLLFIERFASEDPALGAGHRLIRWNLKDDSKTPIRSAKADFVEAMPFALDPKGRWVSYFSFEESPAMILLNLKTGALSRPFPTGTTFVDFHFDGKTVSIFDAERQSAITGEINDKGELKEIKTEERCVTCPFGPLYSAKLAFPASDEEKKSLFVTELASKKTWTLTKNLSHSDSVVKFFDIDPVSKTVIFTEGESAEEMELISARLGEKGLEDRKVLLKGGYIHIPFFAR